LVFGEMLSEASTDCQRSRPRHCIILRATAARREKRGRPCEDGQPL